MTIPVQQNLVLIQKQRQQHHPTKLFSLQVFFSFLDLGFLPSYTMYSVLFKLPNSLSSKNGIFVPFETCLKQAINNTIPLLLAGAEPVTGAEIQSFTEPYLEAFFHKATALQNT